MTRRRRRILRGAMWGCAACSAAAVGAWAWSGWHDYSWWYGSPSRVTSVQVGMGLFMAGTGDYNTWGNGGPPGFSSAFSTHPRRWTSRWFVHSDPTWHVVLVPLWFLALLPVAPAFLFFRLSRRPTPGLCPRCGYDLSGSPTDACPECGAAAKPDATP